MLILLLGIPSLLLYFLYKWLAKKGYKWLGIAIILSSMALLFFSIYTAIYPLDSFYFDDFKKVTSTEIPKSATIIEKTASYPDFHGKYVSCSLIKISKQDYLLLLKRLRNNKNLIENLNVIYSEEFDFVMKNENIKNIKFSFGQQNHTSYIGFFADQKTVVVYFFKT